MHPEALAHPAPPGATGLRAWPARRLRFGLLLTLSTALIVFLAMFQLTAGLFYHLIIVAPIFEELFKFGLALTVASLLRLRAPLLRFAAGVLSGSAFGVLEHFVSYSTEPALLFADRVLFHSGATALSMVAFTVLESYPDPAVRWVATVPATLVHAANNLAAVLVALLAVAVPVPTVALAAFALFGISAYVLAFRFLGDLGARFRAFVASEWEKSTWAEGR